MRRALLALVATLLCAAVLRPARAADDAKPAAAAAAPVAAPGVTVGEMRVQTMPAVTFLYLPIETSFEKMGGPVQESFDKVFFAASEAKLLLVRPTMITYAGGPHVNFDLAKPFKGECGVIVADGTEAAGECKIRKTEPFRCATILYTGGVMEQGKAYEKLIPAMKAANLEPTGEEREMCLYWEGVESQNNVFLMQIGIK